MRALDRKLLRDLWSLKGQAVAIALVIGCGVAMFIAYLSNFDSLRNAQQAYYERQRFADVFANLKRAPQRLERRIATIPGVASVETRVVVDVSLDVPGLREPATGRLISVPGRRRAMLNDIVVRSGRYLEPDRPDEVLISEAFALANDLGPGDSLAAVINGRRRRLEIVGTALSPEYVYSIRPGELVPDDQRFGIIWMERKALATAFDMEGGFNDVALKLMAGASSPEVIARLDRLLATYGGLGAIPRALQLSHWSVDNELMGLQGFGMIVPAIFLGVAAFLLNVVLTRIVSVQREQIAALKALGYEDRSIAWHYIKWSLAVSVLGGGFGLLGGAQLGAGMASLYNDYFRFPGLVHRLSNEVMVGAVLIALAAAVLGARGAVRRAVKLPPAEAMRPEPPARYQVSWVERSGLGRLLSQPVRMVLRNIERQPRRSLVSIIGIAFAAAMMIVGLFFIDALDVLMDVQFNVAQRQDVTLTFVEPLSAGALHAVARLPGVHFAEPMRAVPARLEHGHRSRQISILGLTAAPRLNRVVDASMRAVALPPQGLVVSSKLAQILDIQAGDEVTLRVLEGERPVRRAVVSELVDEYMGTSVYMEDGALHRLMREGGSISGAYLQIDSAHVDPLLRYLKATPAVAGVGLKQAAIDSFKETLAQNINIMIFFNVLFAGIIAFGVVYNAARISLSERSRELASLRVMGFTRAEISFILLGELALITLLAIPVGMGIGYGLAWWVVQVYDTELYRFPLVISFNTLAYAALTVSVAAVFSGLIVRRRLDRLDLVEVLKTRE